MLNFMLRFSQMQESLMRVLFSTAGQRTAGQLESSAGLFEGRGGIFSKRLSQSPPTQRSIREKTNWSKDYLRTAAVEVWQRKVLFGDVHMFQT